MRDRAKIKIKSFSGLVPDVDPTIALWLDANTSTSINAGSPVNNDLMEDWFDIGSNGNDAEQPSIPNQPVYKSSGFGPNNMPCIEFDGSTEFMQLINNSISRFPNVTILSVFESSDVTKAQSVIGSYTAPAGAGFAHRIRLSKQAYSFGDDTVLRSLTGNITLINNTPYVFGSTYSDGDVIAPLELDGVDANSTSFNGTATSNQGVPVPVLIGDWSLGSYRFQGKIAEVKVWNRVLPPAELLSETNILKTKYL